MCGEHHGVQRRECQLAGIIPACAGSTNLKSSVEQLGGDHPRMCGEHKRSPLCAAMRMGSSPHVRGARPKLLVTSTGDGIIPACAGGTSRPPCWTPYRRDHPRMCGEHDQNDPEDVAVPGSSPHVRGAPDPMAVRRDVAGIIPACAGSTSQDSSFLSSFMGSSPHVRGAH